eukprot:490100_1
MAQETAIDSDLSIFKHKILTQDCSSILDCNQIKRIIYALKYCAYLDEKHLIEFCANQYKYLIDDFNHIIIDHHDDMESIYELIHNKYKSLLPLCTLISCLFYKRSNRNRDEDEHNVEFNSNDTQYIVWRDLLDQIHCFMLHLFDAGLRVNKKEIYNIFSDDNEYDNEHCFDSVFDSIYNSTINQRKQLEQLGLRNGRKWYKGKKFNINMDYTAPMEQNKNKHNINFDIPESEMTCIDRLYSLLKANGVDRTELFRLNDYLIDEQYDTDSLLHDLKTTSTSNVSQYFQNKYLFPKITQFIADIQEKQNEQKEQREEEVDTKEEKEEPDNKIWIIAKQIMKPYYDDLNQRFAKASSAFSIGYTFYYWNYYRNR